MRVAQPPSIDGRLDDAIWRTAAHIDTFVQETPVEGAPATEQTDLYVAYDSQQLYFGIHAHYSDPGLIRANRVDRDKTDEEDTVTVFFDPFLDQQSGYSVSVNGYGVQGDAAIRGGSGPNTGQQTDISWNALFASAGQRVEDGWTAEISIPFKSLRYPARGGNEAHRWGFQIQRQIKSKDEVVVWAPVSRDVAGYLRQMGVLAGMANLSTSRNFEVLPTFTAVNSGVLNRTTGDFTTTDAEEGGISVKYGFTSTLTFDFTFNPDFSQIESDRQQVEVNQRFPVLYSEQRPFFLEGAEIFRVTAPVTMVHTRTIVDPKYGAKLSGKVGKTTLGLVVANDEAPGKIDSRSDPAFGRTAQSVLARLRYDFRPASFIGTYFTDREFLASHSRLLGTDMQFQLGRNYRLSGLAVMSDHRDLAGTTRNGHMFETNLRKEGRNFGFFIAQYQTAPDFRTDLGFVRRTDVRNVTGNASYKWWPENWITNWGPQFNVDRLYDYKGILQNGGPGGQLNVEFAKNITVNATIDHDLERYRAIDFTKTRFSLTGRVNTSRRISFSAKIDRGDEIRFVVNPFLGRTTVYNFSTTIRPISRLQSAITLDTTNFMDPRTDTQVFDIKLLRATTTYQFTPRLLVRNIMELNTFNETLFANILVTYRVNSGTAFYVGYDDRYMHGDAIDAKIFPGTEYQRTNRAIFTKLQYLFRSGGSN